MDIQLGLAAILVFGIFAQWISWRFRLPSIILLLGVGFFLGPVTGFLKPDDLFGDLLFPFVSLSVAIILFEGGLGLTFSGLKAHGRVIRNLITLGVLIAWVLIAFFAYFLFKLPALLAILLGAVLVVTGPTVIIPLLKQIHLKPSLAYVLRWEGIVVDPIGATLAVLIFEMIVAGAGHDPLGLVVLVLGGTLFTGVVLGVLSALFLMIILKRHWIPGYLQESLTLMTVIGVYVLSDVIQAESGLLTVTVMGIVLANQRLVTIKHIVSFKENITILLLSTLFIVLAARIEWVELVQFFHFNMFLFLFLLIVVVRPVCVFLCCLGSNFTLKERWFMALMAPRGIVAAAVISLFSIRLLAEGYERSLELIPITFFVILVTVVFYGFMGVFLARFWGLSPSPNGILIAGAHAWSRSLASLLKSYQVPVTLVDTNKDNILEAKALDLPVIHGSILSKAVVDEVEMSSVKAFLAVTASDKTNLLAVQEYADILGDLNVYRLCPKDKSRELLVEKPEGKYLFSKGVTYSYLNARFLAGAKIKPIVFSSKYSYKEFKKAYPKAVYLFLVLKNKRVIIFNDDLKLTPDDGQVLIAMFDK
ncbi:MAG: sodium:proton antiporter [bacterium]